MSETTEDAGEPIVPRTRLSPEESEGEGEGEEEDEPIGTQTRVP